METSTSKFQFSGTGGDFFVHILVVWILTVITIGIYSPWGSCRILRWVAEGTTIDGRSVAFEGTGGSLFVEMLIAGFLTMLTFGIYGPWAYVRLINWTYQNTMFADSLAS